MQHFPKIVDQTFFITLTCFVVILSSQNDKRDKGPVKKAMQKGNLSRSALGGFFMKPIFSNGAEERLLWGSFAQTCITGIISQHIMKIVK